MSLRWLQSVFCAILLSGCGGATVPFGEERARAAAAEVRLLGADGFRARDAAMERLVRGGAGAFEEVWEGLASPDAEVGLRCGRILAAWGWPDPELMRRVRRVREPHVRVLADALQREGPALVEAAARALGTLSADERAELVERLIQDPRPGAAANGALLAGLSGDRRFAEALRARERAEPEEVRMHAAAALARLGDRSALEAWGGRLEKEAGPMAAASRYNLACLHSLAGDPAAALQALGRAREEGFRGWGWAWEDPDLHWARQDPAVKAWIAARLEEEKERR